MTDQAKKRGLCIGGPLDGKELTGNATKMVVPVNPHRPRNPTPESPALEHDAAEYRWANGAWHFAVH
jgi:hypothetical protein